MSYYSILEVTPTTDVWVADYIGPANKIVAKYGGKYLARTSTHERVEGQGKEPALRIIIEWPTRQAAIDFMNDAEYAPHLKARTEGSISRHHLVAAKDDLA
ncbi:DUF1330 domain-containing protein [Shewanella maritima]|uniref:DUF1330 domain-containing protein n=1 Tax=Shewanella maritima TaxID=2520507 RepID=A0A411PIZ7_9GAMM|nr:DUF1330 domain-containing protein [Shewanella maritima]QBF83515.1 DUF1330 domain-containing protein [Shewanella maritima]